MASEWGTVTRASRAPVGGTELSLEELQPQPPGDHFPLSRPAHRAPHRSTHSCTHRLEFGLCFCAFGPSTTSPAAPRSIRTRPQASPLLQHPSPHHPAFPAGLALSIPLGTLWTPDRARVAAPILEWQLAQVSQHLALYPNSPTLVGHSPKCLGDCSTETTPGLLLAKHVPWPLSSPLPPIHNTEGPHPEWPVASATTRPTHTVNSTALPPTALAEASRAPPHLSSGSAPYVSPGKGSWGPPGLSDQAHFKPQPPL